MVALRSVVDEERWGFSFSGFQGDSPVLGKFQDTSFRLRKRIYYNNGFARKFYGQLTPEATGTRIEGYFATDTLTRVFGAIWAIPVALVCFMTLVHLLLGKLSISENSPWVLMPFGMLAAFLLMVRIGLWLSRGGEEFIVDYLEEELHARPESIG